MKWIEGYEWGTLVCVQNPSGTWVERFYNKLYCKHGKLVIQPKIVSKAKRGQQWIPSCTHNKKVHCSVECKVESERGGYIKLTDKYIPDELQKFISPGMIKGFEDYMVKIWK